MEKLLEGSVQLLELIQKYRHHFMYFKKRSSYFVCLPIGMLDFISNTELGDKISIVKMENVLNALLPTDELTTFMKCLTLAYNSENDPEPYLSISKQTLKNVIYHYINIHSNGKKILFVTDNYKIYDLITFTKDRKCIFIPRENLIDRNMVDIDKDKQIDTLRTIMKLEDKEIRMKKYKSINELDKDIVSFMKLKIKK